DCSHGRQGLRLLPRRWFRLYSPTNITTTPLPVVVYFHGGGFAYMSPDSKPFDTLCRRLSLENSAVVVSVNYRYSPEFKYPSQYEDGFDALKFIDERQFKEFPGNADLSRCFIAGDSAGGNLSHHLAVRVAKTDDDELKQVKVIGLIGIQPWFGGQERTESEIKLENGPALSLDRTDWLWKAFLPQGSNRDHLASNVFGPNCCEDISKLKKFPPTLVVVGKWDLLQDWQRRYYEGLKRFGKEAYIVEFPNAFHGFYSLTEFPETPLLFQEVKKFVQNQLAKASGK
ncbi:probable carboxylesterase 18, partial [Papaver somniferum]